MYGKVIVTLASLFVACVIVFYIFGFDIAIYFAILGIPVMFFVVVVYWWYKGKDKTEEIQRVKQEELGNVVYSIVELANRMEDIKVKFGVDVEQAEYELLKVFKTLENLGCIIKKENGRYNFKFDKRRMGRASLGEIREVERSWKDVRDLVLKSLAEGVTKKVEWYIDKLKELESSGYVVHDYVRELEVLKTQALLSGSNAEDLANRAEEVFYSALRKSIDFARNVVENSGMNDLMEKVELAVENLEMKDYSNVVYFLKQVAGEVGISLGEGFYMKRDKLIEKLKIVIGCVREEHAGVFESILRKVEAMNSPTMYFELDKVEKKFLSEIRSVLNEFYDEVVSELRSAKSFSLPEHLIDVVIPEKVEIPDDLDDAVEVFKKTYEKLDYIKSKMEVVKKVIKSYPKVEAIISDVLKKKNVVTPEDVKVKNVEVFFEIYAKTHPEVDYVDGNLVLKGSKPPEPKPKPPEPIDEKPDVEDYEYLCGEKKEKILKYMPKYSGILERLLSEKGYVSSLDDIPIKKKELIPCLLWLWSKEKKLRFTKCDGCYIVYDEVKMGDLIARRINDFVDLSIAEYTYEELKSLVNVELPMEEFKRILEEIAGKVRYRMELGENSVRFSEGVGDDER
jgi:hypothetical protein